jgi:hypothetical protein
VTILYLYGKFQNGFLTYIGRNSLLIPFLATAGEIMVVPTVAAAVDRVVAGKLCNLPLKNRGCTSCLKTATGKITRSPQ